MKNAHTNRKDGNYEKHKELFFLVFSSNLHLNKSSRIRLSGCVSSGDVYESRLSLRELNSLNLRRVVWKNLN